MAKEFFKNLPDTSTPLTAERLNGLLDGEESMGSIIVEDIKNKNLFNINDITNQANISVTILNNTVTIGYGGGMTGRVDFNSIDKTNNKYTLSYNCSYNESRYLLIPYNSSNQVITNLSLTGFAYNSSYNAYYKDFENNTNISDTFELPNTVSYFRIGLVNIDSTNQNDVTYSNIQVEKGTIATDYVEYKDFTNNDIYSTNEIKIGTWINNKPIYRKVIDCGALPNATSKNIAHGISNLDTVTLLRGVAYNSTTGTRLPIPFSDTGNVSWSVQMHCNQTQIVLITGDNKSAYQQSYVIIEYTKTTD